MSRDAIHTTLAPSPTGAYSQAVVAGSFIFTAGVGPLDPASGQVVGETVEEQTHRVLASIREILAEAGATLADVVKTTVHLHDLNRDFSGFNLAYREFFADPYPVRTTVGSTLNGILVEIDVVAVKPDSLGS